MSNLGWIIGVYTWLESPQRHKPEYLKIEFVIKTTEKEKDDYIMEWMKRIKGKDKVKIYIAKIVDIKTIEMDE